MAGPRFGFKKCLGCHRTTTPHRDFCRVCTDLQIAGGSCQA